MSAIKGHPNQGRTRYPDTQTENFVSVVKTDPKNRAGMDVLPKAMYFVSSVPITIETLDISPEGVKNPELKVLKVTGHSVRVGDILRFASGASNRMELPVVKVETDYIYLGGEVVSDPDTETFYHMRHITLTIDEDGNLATTSTPFFFDVVDQLDDVMIDPSDAGFNSGNGIPASSGTPVTVVASLADDVKKIHVIDDIGEFLGLYDGSNNLICILPQGYTGAILDVEIASGTELRIRNMKDAAITTDTRLGINFLG